MAESHREIERLLYVYAERIDLGDFEGVADLFAFATIVGPGGEPGPHGREGVLKMYEATTRRYDDDGTPHTKHVTSNLIIEVDESAGLATCRSYFTVFQALPDFPIQPIVAGRYHDRFERVEGHWRFTERKMMPELFGDMSRHMLIDITGGDQA
jgi:3-phenylpropionate/cinnamic acid dioxygenase small subunit